MKHLFSKLIVIYCVLIGTVITGITLCIMWRAADASSAAIGVMYTFWGGELLLLCLKRILAEKDEDKNKEKEKPEI